MGSQAQKEFYKVSFQVDKDKITRFVRAASETNAKFLIEEKLKVDFPSKKCRIIEVKVLGKASAASEDA